MATIIGAGAEAILFLDKDVTKDRISKTYRIPEIDEKLRKFRTKREAKVLIKLERSGFQSPKLISCDDKQRIVMQYIEGEKLRDILEKGDFKSLAQQVGEQIATLHNLDIIHGDLTTSNMILKDQKVFFIDFGLSFFSAKVEDKAVDLHLFRQALESKHYTIWQECYEAAITCYRKEAKEADEILTRVEQVEKRGRYKKKVQHPMF